MTYSKERVGGRAKNCHAAVTRPMAWTFMLGCLFITLPLFAESAADALKPKWEWKHSSYLFSTEGVKSDYIPEEGTPLRAVYDAMSSIVSRDGKSLLAVFTEDSRPHMRDFVRKWDPRLRGRTVELARQAVWEEKGFAYVGIIGRIGGPKAENKSTFTDVVFLKRVDGAWKLTHEVLDTKECDHVMESLDRKRTKGADEEAAFKQRFEERSARLIREDYERGYRTMLEMTGEKFDAQKMERDYQRCLEDSAYIDQRKKEGTFPTTFREVLDIYTGECLDPPISFDITVEPKNPNFNTLLDAIRTTFYLTALQLKAKPGASLPTLFGWRKHGMDQVEIEGGRPEYLPKLYHGTAVRLAGFGMVQIMARIPVSYKDEDYQVILFNMVETEKASAYRVPIAVGGPKFIGFGYTYFKRDGKRWIPNEDLGGYRGLAGVKDIFAMGDLYNRRHTEWDYKPDDARKLLEEKRDWPASMRRLYSEKDCRDIDDALEAGVWKDLGQKRGQPLNRISAKKPHMRSP